MRQIYTIGETVLDIVFKENIPVAAKAGGSMLNAAVSLGRLGLPIHLITEYGTDQVGMMIDDFLTSNGVKTDFVYQYNDGKSALALAFLDDKNNANYSFYKAYPPKRLDIKFPEVKADDIVLFGSFYGITSEIRETLKEFLDLGNKVGAIILYDPNYRKTHLHELEAFKPVIIENIALSSILRCSDEDIDMIFNIKDDQEAYLMINSLCSNMIYTSSSHAVYLNTLKEKGKFPVRKIDPISTIGAGDNFNAGIVFSLYKQQIKKDDLGRLSHRDWENLITCGIDFASEVCMSYDNYISLNFAKNYSK